MLSPLEQAFETIQTKNVIQYDGPLAGYFPGPLKVGGGRVLVTSGPQLIEAKPGDFPLLAGILEKMFYNPESGLDQRPYLFGWLKIAIAIEALNLGNFKPGQALTIAGPRDSGKSLFQNLVTLILGGRVANAGSV